MGEGVDRVLGRRKFCVVHRKDLNRRVDGWIGAGPVRLLGLWWHGGDGLAVVQERVGLAGEELVPDAVLLEQDLPVGLFRNQGIGGAVLMDEFGALLRGENVKLGRDQLDPVEIRRRGRPNFPDRVRPDVVFVLHVIPLTKIFLHAPQSFVDDNLRPLDFP